MRVVAAAAAAVLCVTRDMADSEGLLHRLVCAKVKPSSVCRFSVVVNQWTTSNVTTKWI